MNHEHSPQSSSRQEAMKWLTEHFPEAFFLKGKQVKPLKIGIFEDVMDFYERLDYPPFSKKLLREAINYYSASKAYLMSQQENAIRIDLFGYEIDKVTKEQAEFAKQRLQQRAKSIPSVAEPANQ